MKIEHVSQLIELDKIVGFATSSLNNDQKSLRQIENIGNRNHNDKSHYVLWVTNVFFDEYKNQIRNRKPLPCYVVNGHYWTMKSDYNKQKEYYDLVGQELNVLEGWLWDRSYKYDCVDQLESLLTTGINYRICSHDLGNNNYSYSLSNSWVARFDNFQLFTTKEEANNYIKQYIKDNDKRLLESKLAEINKQIDELNDKKQLILDQLKNK